MRILVIDTTSRVINIALSCSNGEVFTIKRDIQLNNYEDIVSLIRSISRKSKVQIQQIDYFGVCTGPGSFTGIRIGLSAMKALAYSTNKPLIGYKSLDLLAWMVKEKEKFSGLLCIIQDARRNNIYSAVYSNGRSFRRITPYLLIGVPQLLRELKKLNKKNLTLYFYGDMVSHYKSDIRKSFSNSIILNHQYTNLKNQAMISLTKDNLSQKSNSFEVLPFYMYPKDCQVRKPKK